ncbi:hypothetical protein ABTY63_05595 [Streptomyces solisilvae]
MSDTVEEFEGGGPSEGEFEGESEGRADEDFDAFYARTYPWLAARAVMLSGNRQNAEDAV